MNDNKKFPSFILLLIIVVGTAVFNVYYARAQLTDSVTATVRITVCGNETVEGDEECDRDNLNNQTCIGLGYDGGNLSCDAACEFDVSNCTTDGAPPPSGGGGGGGWTPPSVTTKVIFKGKAYPNSSITILKDGKVATTVKADSNTDFKAEITNLTAGIYTFGLWAKDENDIKSITYTLTFHVQTDTITTVSGIYLPPTIDIDKTKLQRGEILNILGQTIPNVEVDVYIFSEEIIKKAQADEIGAWFLPFNTQSLEDGLHITKARFQLNNEERSGFGEVLSFYIGEGVPPGEPICPRADLNKDGRTNLVDFSILLYQWGTDNVCCDLNGNRVVDLPDFSIMLYYWTG